MPVPQRLSTSLQLRMADEALNESEWLIEQAHDLESPERWHGLSRKIYRQIEEARAALRRLENAVAVLDARLTGVRRIK